MKNYKIANINLAKTGRNEINMAQNEMPGLLELRKRFEKKKPLQGIRVGGSLHMTIQTAVLIETLTALGAQVQWASCNIFSTQDEAAAAVVVGKGTVSNPKGTPVFAWKGETLKEYWELTLDMLTFPPSKNKAQSNTPQLIIDDGGDATLLIHKGFELEQGSQWAYTPSSNKNEEIIKQVLITRNKQDNTFWSRVVKNCKGVSEETTTGIKRLYEREENGTLLFPAININDAITKSKFDNLYGCRESLIDGIKRATDRMIAGKTAVVCGYGNVGKGCAQSLRSFGAEVIVTEVDPICALQAVMEGYKVTLIENTLKEADIFVTATGNTDIITLNHMKKMKDQAIVCNIGHSDNEIQIHALNTYADATRVEVKPQVHRYDFKDGHSIFVLAEGRLVNLSCATGHSSFVMSTSFTNQVFALLTLWDEQDNLAHKVHLLPRTLDEEVAALHLSALGVKLTKLNSTQKKYCNITSSTPFKSDWYTY